MIREKEHSPYPIVIDLTGPDGNAFTLLAYAKRFAKQLDVEYTPIREEMMSGNYENLIQVFDKHFGAYVILER